MTTRRGRWSRPRGWMTDRVVDAHDVVYFDLDGVVYLGPQAVPGAEAALALSLIHI